MPNYRLTLCYDGTRWKGWQKQGNTEQTIQESWRLFCPACWISR
ncbi:MAG: hypothetical protein ACLS43_00360 [Evtepia gabavorous]